MTGYARTPEPDVAGGNASGSPILGVNLRRRRARSALPVLVALLLTGGLATTSAVHRSETSEPRIMATIDVGLWVGGYEVDGEWSFVEVELAENGGDLVAGVDVRFDHSIVDFADPLIIDGDHVRIEVALQSGDLVLDGTMEPSVYAGIANVGGRRGTFELRHVSDLGFSDYRPLVGTYRLNPDETRLLAAVRDRDRYLAYDPEAGREVRLYPLDDGTFLSELGERLTPRKEWIDWVSVDGTTARAKPVELYHEQPVTFRSGKIDVAGTIVVPRGGGPFPAVVIMHNTGSNNREYYRIKAHHLALAGVASLVYDKPGAFDSAHPSLPSFNHNTIQDLVDAALAGVNTLQEHPAVAADQVGLWGYSNSAWAVPLAAAQSLEVAFVINTAASGVQQRQADVFQEDLNNVSHYDYPGWAQRTSLRYLRFTREFAIWARDWNLPLPAPPRDYYGQDFDPTSAWAQVHQPVLVINGQYDTLVDPVDGLARIGEALEEGGNRDHTLMLLANADHSLYRSDTGLITDVRGGRDLVYDAAFLSGVADWINDRFHGSSTTSLSRSVVGSPVPLERSDHFAPGGRYALLPWYGRPVAQVTLLTIFLLVYGSGMMVWPIGGAVRLARRRSSPGPRARDPRHLLRPVGWVASVMNLAVIAGLAVTWVLVVHLRAEAFFGLPGWVGMVPVLGWIAAVLAVASVGLTVWAWRRSPRGGKPTMAVFAITQAAFVWYLAYWQLIL